MRYLQLKFSIYHAMHNIYMTTNVMCNENFDVYDVIRVTMTRFITITNIVIIVLIQLFMDRSSPVFY